MLTCNLQMRSFWEKEFLQLKLRFVVQTTLDWSGPKFNVSSVRGRKATGTEQEATGM